MLTQATSLRLVKRTEPLRTRPRDPMPLPSQGLLGPQARTQPRSRVLGAPSSGYDRQLQPGLFIPTGIHSNILLPVVRSISQKKNMETTRASKN